MSSNLVIVAIPARDEKVWKVSSEKVPHMTLLFLGENTGDVAKLEQIVEFVDHAATMSQRGPFMLDVDERGTLGPDEADVLFFRKDYGLKWVNQFRNQLLQQNDIRTAYDSVQQYPEWQPHLTLGYPATPANEDEIPEHGLSWISFDRIAVWTGDFEGPEFKLTWPDRSQEEGCVAYSSNDARKALGLDALVKELAPIEHHGVKGMRWGVRKAATAVGNAYTKAETHAGDRKFASRANTSGNVKQLVNEASAKMREHDLPAINAKYKGTARVSNKPSIASVSRVPSQKAYKAEVKAAYLKRLHEVANSKTSASGNYKYTIKERNAVRWRVKTVKVQHASVDDGIDEIDVNLILDNDGFVIDIVPAEDSMAQTADIGAEFIEHHGVKGMRWGVRKDTKVTVGGKTKMVSAKKAGRLDKQFENKVHSVDTFIKLHNAAADHVNSQIPRINAEFEKKHPKEMNDGTLFNHLHPVSQAYNKAYTDSVTEGLNKASRDLGTNATGTRQVKIVTKNHESVTDFTWKITTEKVQHAANDVVDEAPIVFQVTLDKNGMITSIKAVEDSMAQTADIGAEFIEHYGIKGMHWGIRSRQGTRSTPTAVAPKVSSKIPHGAKRKTKLEVSGGENHPAHEDAVKVAIAKAKLKKSGPSALSNQELRDVANRVQLENQVAVLTSKKGKQFVTRQLQNEGQNLARAGVRAGVKSGVKKVGVAAGTAAAA